MFNSVYFDISISRSMCAVHSIAVSFSSMTCFPSRPIGYFLNDFQMVPAAPIITGITCNFYIPQTPYSYWNVFIFQDLFGFFLNRIFVS